MSDLSSFRAAWRAARDLLDGVGFDGSSSQFVRYWTLGKDHDHDLAALACAEAEAYVPIYEAKMAAWRVEQAAKAEAEREAERARIEHERQRPQRAQGALRDILENRPWLVQPQQRDLAQRYVALTPAPGHWFTEKLVRMANATLKRVEGRMAEPAAAGGDRVIDDVFREAVLAGCRWISGLDADRARVANAEGWSKAATVNGHYLAGLDSLTATQALHGYMLLRVHRTQLPDDLRRQLALAG